MVCTRSTASLRSKISGFSPPNESADLGFDGLPLNIWKEADPDIPILKQAKAEYAKLQQLIGGVAISNPQVCATKSRRCGAPTKRVDGVQHRGVVSAAKLAPDFLERRTVELPREAAGIERKHPDRECIDPSRPVKSWRSAWRAALKRAKLQVRFHDLRHTRITKLAESQASEQTLMAIAGHVSRSMIEHYSHIRMDAKRRATDAIVEGSVNQNVNRLSASDSNVAAKSLN